MNTINTNLPQVQVEIPPTLENLQLPSPELLQYYKDANDRVIWIDYDIDDTLMNVTKQILEYNKQDKGIPFENRKPIKLLIFTYGGDLYPTLALIDVIKISKTPVYTYNMGLALSAGFQILISGHKRFCLANSKALYHSGSGGTQGTYEQTEAQMREYKKMVAYMENNTLSRTKIDLKTFNKNKSKEWYMDADEQINYGIVDAVIESADELF